MELLAFESFADTCSVAWLEEDLSGLRSTLTATQPRSHASKLAVFANQLIQEKDRSPSGIVVIDGPGSYTGLRIGVSTAKGLAWALDVPLYAISSLHYVAMCAPVASPSPIIVGMMARADEVFIAEFVWDGAQLNRKSPDRAVSLDTFRAVLQQSPRSGRIVSHDKRMINTLDQETPPITAEKVETNLHAVVPYLANQLDSFRVEDLNSFEPAYLKDFVARKAAQSIFEKLPF